MICLNKLSRIGFGSYRIFRKSREHYEALSHALERGCNLIDTSANYTNGESEKLIGEVLSSHPNKDVFIITKAGYIQGENLSLLQELNQLGRAQEDLVQTPTDLLHSIHPDFLESQIKLSCDRLKRSQLDGFLLHNPEYYFEQVGGVTSQGEYYTRIKKAFEFLEEQVEKGLIRYYGISSNTFPFSTALENTTSLPRVLALAREVSECHHFKLIQFPFNLIENDAQKPHDQDHSLIKLAQENGIITFTNRPLNGNCGNISVRFATYEEEICNLDEERDRRFLEEFLELIQHQLDEVGIEDDIMQFVPLQVVSCSWMNFSNPDIVDKVFDQHIFPFMNKLYEGRISEKVLNSFSALRRISVLYAKKSMTEITMSFKQQLTSQGIIAQNDNRPLSLIACQSYLDAGVDHVLVGMKSTKYVDNLVDLF